MNIKIKPLTPDLAEEYVHFFDVTPHDEHIEENKCYCVCWCNEAFEGQDFSTAEKRREYAIQYVKNRNLQGYLAYCDDKIVGWCNANTRSDCFGCVSWKMFMDYVPVEAGADTKVKSVFCYVIAPEFQRKGIATMLLNRVCEDACREGYDCVEAYPYKESGYQSSDFGGHAKMYQNNGFYVSHESEKGFVMRKELRIMKENKS